MLRCPNCGAELLPDEFLPLDVLSGSGFCLSCGKILPPLQKLPQPPTSETRVSADDDEDEDFDGESNERVVRPAQQRGARLVVRRPGGQAETYTLEDKKTIITIGRSFYNDIVLSNSNVSDQHAIIKQSNVGCIIEDKHSAHGTYVDGKRISYPLVLHTGQFITIANYILTFELDNEPTLKTLPIPKEPEPEKAKKEREVADLFPKLAESPALTPTPVPALPSTSTEASRGIRPKVFVSHSHKNDDFTKRLVKDLRAAGIEVWVDMTNLQHGDFMTRINEALSASEWLVLVLTPEALASPAVHTEVNAAVNMVWSQELKGVIPFLARPCDPKSIPPMWKNLQRYDATSDYHSALAGLLRALGVEG